MANWCWNHVTFNGTPEQTEQVFALFRELAEKEKTTGMGQLPAFVSDNNGGYFFNIDANDQVLSYQTKWAPNTDLLINIADHYAVGFSSSYSELGMLVYGEAEYADGELKEVYLEEADFRQYIHDEDKDHYLIDGERYDSEWDILDILLERKKAAESPAQIKR